MCLFINKFIHPSIHSVRTETKVQLYCPVYGEHATIVFIQSFYAFPPYFLSFPLFFLPLLHVISVYSRVMPVPDSTQVLNATF